MKINRLILSTSVLFILSFSACKNTEVITKKAIENPSAYSTSAVLWQQQSAEYEALCYQAYHLAKLNLDKIIKNDVDNSLAIVMDLDETVMDNSPYNAMLIKTGQSYSFESWRKWTALKQAQLIPGSLEFIKYAKEKSVTVIFISNRMEEEIEDTQLNLAQEGLEEINFENFYFKTNSSSKDERRAKVEDQFKVVMYIGDNLGDFNGNFDKQNSKARKEVLNKYSQEIGSKYIILPNPMYGEWEGAIYNFNYKLSNSEKEQIRLNTLKSYSNEK